MKLSARFNCGNINFLPLRLDCSSLTFKRPVLPTL